MAAAFQKFIVLVPTLLTLDSACIQTPIPNNTSDNCKDSRCTDSLASFKTRRPGVIDQDFVKGSEVGAEFWTLGLDRMATGSHLARELSSCRGSSVFEHIWGISVFQVRWSSNFEVCTWCLQACWKLTFETPISHRPLLLHLLLLSREHLPTGEGIGEERRTWGSLCWVTVSGS